MPIYIYQCPECGHEEENCLPMEHTPPDCPNCARQMERRYSSFIFVMSDKKRKKQLTGHKQQIW